METKKLPMEELLDYVKRQLHYLENEIQVADRNESFLVGMRHAYQNILDDFDLNGHKEE